MHEIYIKEFGPLKEVSLPVKDLMLFIGPQASGKSTIAKWIYLFKSFKDIVVAQLREDIVSVEETYNEILRKFSKNAVRYFGQTFFDILHGSIKYSYTSEAFITISGRITNDNKNEVFIDSNDNLKDGLREIMEKRKAITQKLLEIDDKLKTTLSSVESSTLREEKEGYLKELKKEVEKLFDDDTAPMYIPAGRSTTAVIGGQLQKTSPDAFEGTMVEHINRITDIKPLFKDSLDDIVKNYEYSTGEKADKTAMDYVIKQMYKILKGEYRYLNSNDLIYLEDGKSILLQLASSGQQEVLWILNILFLIVLRKYNVSLIIEEPEAHIHPVAQKDLVELIAFVMNYTGSQVMITTHSPYILTAFNNLIYAGNIGKTKAAEVSKIIDKTLWVDIDKTGVHFVEDGKTRDIIDKDYHIIEAAEIDKVSTTLNETFDKLYDLED